MQIAEVQCNFIAKTARFLPRLFGQNTHNSDDRAVNWRSRSFKVINFCCNWKQSKPTEKGGVNKRYCMQQKTRTADLFHCKRGINSHDLDMSNNKQITIIKNWCCIQWYHCLAGLESRFAYPRPRTKTLMSKTKTETKDLQYQCWRFNRWWTVTNKNYSKQKICAYAIYFSAAFRSIVAHSQQLNTCLTQFF